MFDMTVENFLWNDELDVFSFGVPPVSIDLLTKAKGLEFDEAFTSATWVDKGEVRIKLISLKDLIKLKKSANRPKDINDIEHLPDPD